MDCHFSASYSGIIFRILPFGFSDSMSTSEHTTVLASRGRTARLCMMNIGGLIYYIYITSTSVDSQLAI